MTIIIDDTLQLEHVNFSAPEAAPRGAPLGIAFCADGESWDTTVTADVNNARWQMTGVPAYVYQLLELSVEVEAYTVGTAASSIQDAREFVENTRGYYQQQPLMGDVSDRTKPNNPLTDGQYATRRWALEWRDAQYRGTDTTGTVQPQGAYLIGTLPVCQGSPASRWTGISAQAAQATPRVWLSFPAITSALSGSNTLVFRIYASYLYFAAEDALSAAFQYAAPVAPR